MKIIHLDDVDSTNNWLKDHWDEYDHPICIVARQQSLGRGRHGRHWNSPPGNLYCSFSCDQAPPELNLLPLVAGVAVVEGLAKWIPLKLKWPNDLIIEGKKMGGILCESLFQGSRWKGSFVGLGLNIQNRPELDDETDVKEVSSSPLNPPTRPHSLRLRGELEATHLNAYLDEELDLDDILLAILGSFERIFHDWKNGGDPLVDYRRYCINLGKEVKVEIAAKMVDINASGGLVLKLQAGEIQVGLGEVLTLRALKE